MARSKKPSPTEGAARKIGIWRMVILAAFGLVGALGAFALAVSGVTRVKNPAAALALMPNEGTALATRADQLFFANPQKPPREARAMAAAALRQQAINPKALRLLGYYSDLQGDNAKASQYVLMAQKLSRREAGAQLWLIEAEAREGDAPQALVHYDIALRTKPDIQAILFPRLLSAIEDPAIRAELKPYIRAKDGWGGNFLFFANANSKNLPVLVDLIAETGGLADQEDAKNQALGLLQRLVNEQYFADARRLYLRMPGAKPARMTSAAFDRSDRDSSFGPMGWQMIDDPDAGGGFTGKNDDGPAMLSVFANSATTRPVASRLLYLKPGNYNFASQLASIDRGDGGFLRWQLRCLSDKGGPTIWTLDSINMTTKARLAIPDSCTVQLLSLIVSGGRGQTGLEATVSRVSITADGN
jgi:tetratricopeptide (TPR) repeat protein